MNTLKSDKNLSRDYRTVRYQGIDVCYTDELECGGLSFGQDYVRYLTATVGPVDRAFEWCSGPGLIGFSLLANGLCNSLCLADVNPAAVDAVKATIDTNGLHERVSVYVSDCLDSIPRNESWDLVVGNPPHSPRDVEVPCFGKKLLYQDRDWSLHRRFYRDVGRFLKPGGRVIIQEGYVFSKPSDFADIVEPYGLIIRRSALAFVLKLPTYIYYLWSEKPGEHSTSTNMHNCRSSPGAWEFPFSSDGPGVAERQVLEELGFYKRPNFSAPKEILAHRAKLLRSSEDAIQTLRKHLPVKLIITGQKESRWLLTPQGDIIATDGDANATVTLSEELFLDLYNRRLDPLYAYGYELAEIHGDKKAGLAVGLFLFDLQRLPVWFSAPPR